MTLHLEDDHYCYVCGKDNAAGFRLDFEHSPGRLRSQVTFRREHQGFKGIVHGGMLALMLDEMIVNLAWKEGLGAVTAELTVRLKKPTPVGKVIYLESLVEKQQGRAVIATATATDKEGTLFAEARATCLRVKPKAKCC